MSCSRFTGSYGHGSGEGGREVYLQSSLLTRTVLVARAQTALYLAAGLLILVQAREPRGNRHAFSKILARPFETQKHYTFLSLHVSLAQPAPRHARHSTPR